ncbi:MAG TPA: tetratricopeptide repeat protein [Candidatus Krumholzibacteria bacterium]|nr:tetratricopeptide repeat protein [Candidatus Krumholzibacteria bacterium]
MYTSRSARVKPGRRAPFGRPWVFGLGALCFLLFFMAGAGFAGDRYDAARAREALLAQLTAQFEAGHYARVLSVFEDSLQSKDTTPRLWNLRGLVLAQLARHREAVAAYEEGLRAEDSLFELHMNLAKSLQALGRTGRAMAEYRRAVELAPQELEPRLALGAGYLDYHRLAEAKEQLEVARRMAPDDLRVLRQRARLADASQDTTQAWKLWTQLEKEHPGADTARRLAELVRANSKDAAISWYERCAGRDSTALDCAAAAGSLLLAQGKAKEAVPWLRMAVAGKQPPQKSLYNLLLAWQSLAQADSIEALARRHPPQLAQSWGVVAMTRRERGELPRALEAARKGVELDPEDLNLANLQAVILLELGKKEEAKQIWRQILEKDPENALAKSNLEQAG